MTFQTGKNSQQYLPRESSRQQHGHKDDVCREGLGNTCADDSKLLTEFCLIAHSSKLANPKKEGAKRRTSPCHTWLAKLWETSFTLFQGQWKFLSMKSTG